MHPKVLILNDHLYADGGADVVALNSADSLSALGVDVTLFVGDALRADDSRRRDHKLVCTGQSDLAHDPNRVRAAMQGLWNHRAARMLRQELGSLDPRQTVVHLHSWTKSLSSSVVSVVKDLEFPLVLTLHDYFPICPTGGLFDFREGVICHRAPMSLDCIGTNCDARKYSHKLFRVLRQSVQSRFGGLPGQIDDYIAVSHFSERILRPRLPAHARVHHVRNPIEVSRGPPTDVSAGSSFVMVGHLLRHKGQELLLEACERVGASAVCIGAGPDLDDLRRRFPRARFTGQIPREQVIAEMRSARALVLSSLWYETQGLVVQEAAALGLPAIVGDSCAATDFVEHDQCGLIFRTGDVESLADAVRCLHQDPARAARLGAAAYQKFWADPPTPRRHAEGLLAAYEDVIARHQRQRGVSTPLEVPQS